MQFLILAYDATDADAPSRRMSARDAHLAHMAKAKAAGQAKIGAAILDDAEKMIGSCIIADFPTRAEFDAWLASDPYKMQKVWGDIEVKACKIAPSFI